MAGLLTRRIEVDFMKVNHDSSSQEQTVYSKISITSDIAQIDFAIRKDYTLEPDEAEIVIYNTDYYPVNGDIIVVKAGYKPSVYQLFRGVVIGHEEVTSGGNYAHIIKAVDESKVFLDTEVEATYKKGAKWIGVMISLCEKAGLKIGYVSSKGVTEKDKVFMDKKKTFELRPLSEHLQEIKDIIGIEIEEDTNLAEGYRLYITDGAIYSYEGAGYYSTGSLYNTGNGIMGGSSVINKRNGLMQIGFATRAGSDNMYLARTILMGMFRVDSVIYIDGERNKGTFRVVEIVHRANDKEFNTEMTVEKGSVTADQQFLISGKILY